jgi:hypothetical protein
MPRIEIVVSRDPDSSNELWVYVDGEPVDAKIYQIDAGAGYEWGDWIESGAEDILAASPRAAETIFGLVAEPVGSRFIDGYPDDPAVAHQELSLTVASIRSAKADK